MSQVNRLPVLALDLNTSDPLLACHRDKTLITAKTQPGNQERRFHEFPAARLTQDLPTPFWKLYPEEVGQGAAKRIKAEEEFPKQGTLLEDVDKTQEAPRGPRPGGGYGSRTFAERRPGGSRPGGSFIQKTLAKRRLKGSRPRRSRGSRARHLRT